MSGAEQQLTRVKVDIIRCHSHSLPQDSMPKCVCARVCISLSPSVCVCFFLLFNSLPKATVEEGKKGHFRVCGEFKYLLAKYSFSLFCGAFIGEETELLLLLLEEISAASPD